MILFNHFFAGSEWLQVLLSNTIGLVGRVFANGPGDLGSIPGRVIPKTQKMVLDASLLNTQHYKVRIKGKVEQSRKRSSAIPRLSSYWKRRHRVTLDYSRLLYFLKFYSILFLRLYRIKWFQILRCITNNSIKHQSFIYAQLNNQTVLFLTIQLDISHLFAHSLNVKQFYTRLGQSYLSAEM